MPERKRPSALRRLMGWRPGRAADAGPLPEPEVPVCVIGDVHGRYDLLCALLARLDAAADAVPPRLILVGDLIDRGPDSARVLALVRRMTEAAPGRIEALMGNHEEMMLAALDDPDGAGLRWLTHGGAETLHSFGIDPLASGPDPGTRVRRALAALRDALPPGTEAWLRARPPLWRDGRLAVCHAGADPGLPIEAQPPRTLIWGHRDFLHRPRRDGLWVAHGHTVVPQPLAAGGRIAVDTGAWATGRLTAAWIGADGVTFIGTG